MRIPCLYLCMVMQIWILIDAYIVFCFVVVVVVVVVVFCTAPQHFECGNAV